MYVTSHTHSFGLKAARILGLKVRTINVDDEVVMGKDNEAEVGGWGLGVKKLKEAVEEDLGHGLQPFILGEPFDFRNLLQFGRLVDVRRIQWPP